LPLIIFNKIKIR